MKINWNVYCFLLLLSCTIGLTIFLFAISLLTDYLFLQYITITTVYLLVIYSVKIVHKKELIKKHM
jgi:hypothetical protein